MPYGFGTNVGGFAANQHGAVATSTGRRKHLNLLLEDRAEENFKTYGWVTMRAGCTMTNYQGVDLTQTAVAELKASRGPHSPGESMGAMQQQQQQQQQQPAATSFAGMSTTGGSLGDKPAPWLMPWQTGNRTAGRLRADHVRSRRSPIGSFSILTLAKDKR
ncbi:hypothetical protein FOA52_014802 [Chlamydomonas sp. UWO 241]|nr:hypothetical protein FOA52_014802 [Chlamydomonas sp. UWO 241]